MYSNVTYRTRSIESLQIYLPSLSVRFHAVGMQKCLLLRAATRPGSCSVILGWGSQGYVLCRCSVLMTRKQWSAASAAATAIYLGFCMSAFVVYMFVRKPSAINWLLLVLLSVSTTVGTLILIAKARILSSTWCDPKMYLHRILFSPRNLLRSFQTYKQQDNERGLTGCSATGKYR